MNVVIAQPDPRDTPRRARTALLWLGLLGAPVAWLVQLEAAYALTPWCCTRGIEWPLHAANIACLALALASSAAALHDWRRPRAVNTGPQDPRAIERTRFMGMIGFLSGGIFLLLVLAQCAATFIFSPCEV